MKLELGMLWAILIFVIGQSAAITALWREIAKRRCPFGDCPVFERARTEAAPRRLVGQAKNELEVAKE